MAFPAATVGQLSELRWCWEGRAQVGPGDQGQTRQKPWEGGVPPRGSQGPVLLRPRPRCGEQHGLTLRGSELRVVGCLAGCSPGGQAWGASRALGSEGPVERPPWVQRVMRGCGKAPSDRAGRLAHGGGDGGGGGGHGERSLGEPHGWGPQEEAGRGRGRASTQLWTWRPSGGRGEGTVGGRRWGCFDDGDGPVSCSARRSRWAGWCPKSPLAVDPAPSPRSRRSLRGSAGPCLAPHLGDPGAWAFTPPASAAPYVLCGPTCFCQHPRRPQPWGRAGAGPRDAGASGRPSTHSVWLFTGPWGLPLEPGAPGLLSGRGWMPK